MSITKKLDGIFAPIEAIAYEFASKNGLQILKCPRGNSGWELVREHAEGGHITLLLIYDDKHGLGICSNWQVPSVEMGLLYTHFRNIESATSIDPSSVVND
jgi:hypothetical protein